MPERKRYQREYFHSEQDGMEVRIGFSTDRGRVSEFTVQLECWIDGQWRPVMRYDTAHDQAHRDTLDWSGSVVDKLWLLAEKDYNSALSEAIRDLSEHGRTYRDEFLGKEAAMTAPVEAIARADSAGTIQARRIELHVALGRAIMKNPSILEEIPNHAVVALIPHDADETFIDAEVSLGIDALKKGRSVYFKRLAPGEWGIDGERSAAE